MLVRTSFMSQPAKRRSKVLYYISHLANFKPCSVKKSGQAFYPVTCPFFGQTPQGFKPSVIQSIPHHHLFVKLLWKKNGAGWQWRVADPAPGGYGSIILHSPTFVKSPFGKNGTDWQGEVAQPVPVKPYLLYARFTVSH